MPPGVEFPVVTADDGHGVPRGVALCLSGGGYRAMLYHVGSLWYLHDAGMLRGVDRISSVSGGSITAAHLALRWSALYGSNGNGDFAREVVAPIRALARKTIDVKSVLGGVFLRGTVSDRVMKAYREHLYGDATLQDLPDTPRFVINATSVQTGALFRFSKPYIGDYQVGQCMSPKRLVAEAVTASSAFPPVLSPVKLKFAPGDFSANLGPCGSPPFTTDVVLTDGGVYDNMGIETAWKRCDTILVSDGGGKMQPEADPHSDWARHSLRVNGLIDNQVRSLRKRQIIAAFEAGERKGAYWGIWTDAAEYRKVQSALNLPVDATRRLAQTPTRLAAMNDGLQERLINLGFGMTERAVRCYYKQDAPGAKHFPYPVGV